MHRTEGSCNENNLFADGPPGTTIEAAILNAIQEEIAYVIEDAGIVLKTASTETRTQLKEAIDSLVSGGAVSDDVYNEGAWNGVTGIAPSKNAIRDKIETMVGGSISDDVYNEGAWNGVTGIAPSKNAVRDKIESMAGFAQPYKYVVDAAGGGDFTTITAALAALGTSPGEIKVREGTYGAGESFPFVIYPYQALKGSGVEATFITPTALGAGHIIELAPRTIGGVLTIPAVEVSNLTIDGKNTSGSVCGIYEPATVQGLYCRPGTSLYQGSCSPGSGPDGTRKVLKDLRIWNMRGRGIDLSGGGNAILTDIDVAQCGRTGIHLSTNPLHGTMHRCVVEFCGTLNMGGDNYGVHLENVQAFMFTNSFFVLNQGHNFHAYTSSSQDQLCFVGCIFEASLAGDELCIENYRGSRIANCHFGGSGLINTASIRLLYVGTSVISGNVIGHQTYDGIYVSNCSNCIISGNVVDKPSLIRYAMYVIGGTGLTMVGNAWEALDTLLAPPPTTSIEVQNKITAGGGLGFAAVSAAGLVGGFNFHPNGDLIRSLDGKKAHWV